MGPATSRADRERTASRECGSRRHREADPVRFPEDRLIDGIGYDPVRLPARGQVIPRVRELLN
jgi:hypothetical protein